MDRVRWEVEYTDQFEEWWSKLTGSQQNRVAVAVGSLQLHGPGLGRPFVDTVTTSRHANMKELRPPGGNLRVLFAFDPRRMAILLLGGDKTDKWREWYRVMVPIADDLYGEHLTALDAEGDM